MVEIKELVERIEDELEGAEKYAELAAEHEHIDDGLSALYASHAYDELTHADELHTEAVMLIKQARAEGHMPTQEMLAKWNEEHKNYIERLRILRTRLA